MSTTELSVSRVVPWILAETMSRATVEKNPVKWTGGLWNTGDPLNYKISKEGTANFLQSSCVQQASTIAAKFRPWLICSLRYRGSDAWATRTGTCAGAPVCTAYSNITFLGVQAGYSRDYKGTVTPVAPVIGMVIEPTKLVEHPSGPLSDEFFLAGVPE